MEDNEWYELETGPREPGKLRITFNGPPQDFGPYTIVCEDCGAECRSGGGTKFGDFSCKQHSNINVPDCLPIHCHWGEDCPAWKHRWWRLWNRGFIGGIKKRRKQAKYRKWRNKERSDPNKWVEFWSKEGGDDD